ncbi:hypothetical protein L8V83_06425 [Campylobacter lari]|nr:hypothetical protein [Campylobacter lari]
MIEETLEKILHTLEKCCDQIQHYKSKDDENQNKDDENKNREIKNIIVKALKIPEDKVALNDDRIFTIAIEGSKEDKLYIDNIEIDVVSSLGNLEDKENIHTIFVKYNFEFKFCIFKKIALRDGLELQNFSFENCDIKDEVDLNMSEFKSLSFCNCNFDKNANFSYMKIHNKASFSRCNFKDKVDFADAELKNNDCDIFSKCNFEKKVNFTNFTFDEDMNGLFFRDEVVFDGVKFLKKITLSEDNFTQKDIKFEKCVFEEVDIEDNFLKSKNISFKSCEFNQVIAFENKTIENLTFGTCIFNKGVYFVFCNFFDVKIYSCSFNQPASFYGTTFNMVPNFSQSIFKDNFNALNITLNFTFDNLKKQIKQESENFNKDTNEQYQKSLDKFANDFRDSFRVFKNALIKDNNLLEASKFHKYELYCKEIELKENQNKKDEYVENVIDVEKNMWRVRELVDFLLLGFYRKLCDHHTDVFKVFNNLILLVALYVLFSSSFIWVHSDKLKNTREILDIYDFFDGFHFYIDIGVAIFLLLGCMFILYKLKVYESKNKILNKQKINFIYIIKDFCNFIKSLFLAVFIPCVFYVILGQIFSFIFNLDKYSLFVNTLFVSLYICVVYTKSLFFGRYVVLILSYMYFFVILIEQPSAIHPLIGKITNEPDKNFNYPSLMTLYILYTILVALVIFSLQKTARKNSIVPS